MQLLSYFGEKDSQPCGICSVCTDSIKDSINESEDVLMERIISALRNKELSSRQITKVVNIDSEWLILLLKKMLERDMIQINSNNTYSLKNE